MLKVFRPARRSAPSTETGERVYVIGDVHGRLDLLRDLLAKVEEHAGTLPHNAATHVILLGDLIDRGEQSREVLGFVYEAQQRSDRLIVLLGNHEDMMLKALDRTPGALRAWMRIGGKATVRSFGLEPPDAAEDSRAYAERLAREVPQEWVEWLRRLPLNAVSGSYMFCHAGVRPGVALKKQARTDLLWIREEFLTNETNHGAVIVHGHSIANDVEFRANRIGIDTGAYRTGVLTALYLEGEKRQILSTVAAAVGVSSGSDEDVATAGAAEQDPPPSVRR